MTTEPNDFSTVADVASILKLNRQTVRNWVDQGKLPAVHIGRRVRIRRTEFDAVIATSVIGGPPRAVRSIWDGDIPQLQVPGGE